jgi:hypothetical protein
MTDNTTLTKESWLVTAGARLERDAMLLHTGLEIVDVKTDPARVVMKWPHESVPKPWMLEIEDVAMVLARETAWAAATLGLGHFDVHLDRLNLRFPRKLPLGKAIFCATQGTVTGLEPDDSPRLYHADVAGTMYVHDEHDTPVVVSEFSARVCQD